MFDAMPQHEDVTARVPIHDTLHEGAQADCENR
jgi:hypothetical protein